MRLWLKLTVASLLLGVLMWVVYQTASQLLWATLSQQLRAHGDALARPLAAALLTPLRQHDAAAAQAVLDDVADAGLVKRLRLSDNRQQQLASSGDNSQALAAELATAYADSHGEPRMDFQVALDAAGQRFGMLRYALSAQALSDAQASWQHQMLQISALAALVLGLLVVLVNRRLARQHLRQLHQARDAAEAANRAKSAFLANTSHELRTPLNGVLGMARLARQPGLDEPRRQRYLDLLVDSAKSLADILSDTLDLAKIEAGKLALDPRPFDPRLLLNTTLASYRPLADGAGLTLALQIDAGVPALLLGDAPRVRQILINYLGNALKFTPQGKVQVRLTVAGGERLRLAVQDTGVGLPAEVQTRLFTPFTQADVSTTRRHGGTGLGLAICRELAQLMDGEVGVDSTPGVGSTFWAELRLPAAAGAAATPCVPQHDAPLLQGARALVVEDNAVNRILAVSLLENWGMVTAQAEDGQQAVDAVARAAAAGTPFDIVLMDLQMPVMDGHAATRQLRRLYNDVELPIVALTAAALAAEREKSLASGMNDFLTKPVDPVALQAALCQQLRRMVG